MPASLFCQLFKHQCFDGTEMRKRRKTPRWVIAEAAYRGAEAWVEGVGLN